jgi:pimeloyl-ACP methyl ester carboxylesterase
MHFRGVEDPRFVRFGGILRAAGATVTAADVVGLRELRLSPAMFEDAERALLEASRDGPVGVMSVSFGSIVALHLAANFPERVRRLVVFGGYRDLEAALGYALGGPGAGEGEGPGQGQSPSGPRVRDPLNAPAVFIQLVDWAEELLPEGQREAFVQACRRFCAETWSTGAGGAADDKYDGRHLRVGARLAESLDGEARALFRVACRLDGDAYSVAMEALARSRERFRFLDPEPFLGRIRCEVDCVHGRDDDVIPYTESEALADAITRLGGRARAHITGLYGHTGARGSVSLRAVRELAQEGATMVAVLRVVERLVSRG